MATLSQNTEDLNFVKNDLHSKAWLVACLCAAWCDTCETYREQFDLLVKQHPDKCFAWIDIEDQADLVDAVDIENFPTILIQHQDTNVFFGTMLPDTSQLNRLLNSFTTSLEENGGTMETGRISALNQDVPQDWSLRRLILKKAR
jgi:thioredoxin 1